MYGNRAQAITVLAIILTAAIFTAAPGIDIAASRLFYDPGRLFAARNDSDLIGLRAIGMNIPTAVVVAFVAALLAKIAMPTLKLFADARNLVAVILVFAMGPGLLVNGVLKEHWSRPRPNQVENFSGPWPFKAWYDTSGKCRSNCSFVSGEASSAMATVAAAAAMPAPIAGPAAILALVFAGGVSALRLAFGGHFLSDLLFALLFTQLIAIYCFRLLHNAAWPWGRDGAIEGWLASIGLRIRSALRKALPRL